MTTHEDVSRRDAKHPIAARMQPAVNILVTLAVLYLYYVYGALSGWWMKLFSDSVELRRQGSSFHEVADPIYYAVLILLSLNMASAFLFVREREDRLSKVALFAVVTGLGLAILIQF